MKTYRVCKRADAFYGALFGYNKQKLRQELLACSVVFKQVAPS